MSKVTVTWPVGQFLTTVTAEVNEAQLPAILARALKAEAQRISEVDKVLAESAGIALTVKNAAGKNIRNPDYSRGDVDYSTEAAKKLETAIADGVSKGTEEEPALFSNVTVATEKYEGSVSEPKYKSEKDLIGLYLISNDGKLSTGEPRTVESFCANRGITPPEGAEWQTDSAFLARVKAWSVAEKAKQD